MSVIEFPAGRVGYPPPDDTARELVRLRAIAARAHDRNNLTAIVADGITTSKSPAMIVSRIRDFLMAE